MTKGKIALERAKIMKETSNRIYNLRKRFRTKRNRGSFWYKTTPEYQISKLQIYLKILEKDPKRDKKENTELKTKVLEMINVVL